MLTIICAQWYMQIWYMVYANGGGKFKVKIYMHNGSKDTCWWGKGWGVKGKVKIYMAHCRAKAGGKSLRAPLSGGKGMT